jgi:predicted flap endonuclease-1-like 5' DNA nuclease
MSGRRFPGRDRSTRKTPTFQVDDIPYVETEKLAPIERAAIERTVTEREAVIQELQTGVVELRSERNALESQLSRLESERDELQERLRQLEVERPALEPSTVFTNLGSAIGEVQTDLGDANYTIGDVEFNLKANVVQSDEGLRMHLPSIDETFASANLSEITFRVQASGDTGETPDYREVPDLLGLDRTSAERQLAQAGLTVGEVATTDSARDPPGTVVDQFPEPYALGEPGAPVDLTVTVEPPDAGDVTAPSGPETEALREEFELAIARAELDPESELAERLAAAGVDDLREVSALTPEHLAELTGIPVDTVDALHEALTDRMDAAPAPQLSDIDGLGPTYIERLENAGVTSVRDLAELDPEAVAEVTEASPTRAKGWLEQARSLLE